MQAGLGHNTGKSDLPLSAWGLEVASSLDLTRQRTLAFVEPIPDAILATPACDFLSPLLWDLAHIASFEELWLVDAVEGRQGRRLAPRFDALATPRSRRGEVSVPSRSECYACLAAVRGEALKLLAATDPATRDPLLRDGYVYRMVLQHEGQHHETMLQSLDLMAASDAALSDAFAAQGQAAADVAPDGGVDDSRRVQVPSGSFVMGTDNRTHAYDNERGCHEVSLAAFDIDRYPVTNRRWLRFMDDAGYERPELWSARGNAWRRDPGCGPHPQGWAKDAGERTVRRPGSERPLAPDEPVQHVCYWEAEAFARWCGGRLPTEAEWEKAASWDPQASAARTYPWGSRAPADVGFEWGDPSAGMSVERGPGPSGLWGPERVGRRPELASPYGVEDMLGGVYAWTSSKLAAYPGFEPFPYAEYSEVFFGDTYRVLRGASWAAHPLLWRNSYRNWDLPQRRQIFAGLRVVYDT